MFQCGFKFPRSGAMHNARFMAKAIYLAMMSLLQNQLSFLSDTDKSKINRVNLFCMLWYVPMFLQSSIACKAPSTDFAAITDMRNYSKFETEVAMEVYLSLKRHGWYLTEKMAIMGIVDEDIEPEIRQKMAEKLNRAQVPEQFETGYEALPDIAGFEDMSDLIGPNSWYLLELANIHGDWLKKHVSVWQDSQDYAKFKEFISNMSVVNDCSERGVKLVQEYIDSARNETLRQDVMTTAKVYKSKINSKKLS